MAGVQAEDIDMIIMATSSPDDIFGSACLVQQQIGAKNAVAFDLTAACTGFVLAIATAAQYIRSGTFKHILVIGADCLTRYLDWTDRRTCILFGDGAGALVMGPTAGNQCGLLGLDLHSDGKGRQHLFTNYTGETAKPLTGSSSCLARDASYSNIAMSGQEVFKFAVRKVPQTVDWLVLHQANQRILDAAADRLAVPHDRVITNVAQFGNTSAASIPLALDGAVRDGRITKGNVLAMAGFGAGLTWGSLVIKWG